MALVYLVRHGKAAAAWDADPDPGLDPLGRDQAEAMATALAAKGPLPLLASPLRRTRETAAALERRWRSAAAIEPRVAEIPSPIAELAQRRQWLDGVMQRRWLELDEALQTWRRGVIEALAALRRDSVVISHFIAINVAVGAATGDDRVQCFRPENCSCTVIEATDGGGLRLVALGAEGAARLT